MEVSGRSCASYVTVPTGRIGLSEASRLTPWRDRSGSLESLEKESGDGGFGPLSRWRMCVAVRQSNWATPCGSTFHFPEKPHKEAEPIITLSLDVDHSFFSGFRETEKLGVGCGGGGLWAHWGSRCPYFSPEFSSQDCDHLDEPRARACTSFLICNMALARDYGILIS